jgi:ribose 5-phosphate isomerase B
MKIAIGSDHAGYELKKKIAEWLKENDFQVLDFGCFSAESVDYPDYAFPTAEAVAANIADYGILICGTGIGVNITANKVMSIRAANCLTPEMATTAREHNNANILTMGSRLISLEQAIAITQAFVEGEFQGGRHMIRIEKIHYLTGN